YQDSDWRIRYPGSAGRIGGQSGCGREKGGGKKGTADLSTRVRQLFRPVEDHRLADTVRHVIVKTIEARLDGNAETEDKGIRWLAARYDTVKEASTPAYPRAEDSFNSRTARMTARWTLNTERWFG